MKTFHQIWLEADAIDQQRLVRNEKARRRTALKAVLKPLPEEIEAMIMLHLKNPYYIWHGRPILDVSMRWQTHPNAKLITDLRDKLAFIRDHNYWGGGIRNRHWGEQNHFYRYLSLIVNEYLNSDCIYIESYFQYLIILIRKLKELPFKVKSNIYNSITEKLDAIGIEYDIYI